MNGIAEVTSDEVQNFFERLAREADLSGYYLNPDEAFTKELVRGLIVNVKRHGYASCPCRLSEGDKWKDMDIICPCDYRDRDLAEFGTCYCALYVSKDLLKEERLPGPIPERRLSPDERPARHVLPSPAGSVAVAYPVWRCKVCGYLCAREQPPEACPICRANQERFERFF